MLRHRACGRPRWPHSGEHPPPGRRPCRLEPGGGRRGEHRHLGRVRPRGGRDPHPRRPHRLAPLRLDGAALDGGSTGRRPGLRQGAGRCAAGRDRRDAARLRDRPASSEEIVGTGAGREDGKPECGRRDRSGDRVVGRIRRAHPGRAETAGAPSFHRDRCVPGGRHERRRRVLPRRRRLARPPDRWCRLDPSRRRRGVLRARLDPRCAAHGTPRSSGSSFAPSASCSSSPALRWSLQGIL